MNHDHTGSVVGNVGTTDIIHRHSFSGTTEEMTKNSNGYFYGNAGTTTDNGSAGICSMRESGTTAGTSKSSRRNRIDIEIQHEHNFKGYTTYYRGIHNHPWDGSVTIDTKTADTGSVGDGTAHENMPPYLVKFCWERTA